MPKPKAMNNQKPKTAKSAINRLDSDPETVKRVKEQLADKYLMAAALFAQRAVEHMPRIGGYQSALVSGIFHDHFLKAMGKTSPGVVVLVNVPGMGPMTLNLGPAQGADQSTKEPTIDVPSTGRQPDPGAPPPGGRRTCDRRRA